jgi:hypothetical protein
MLQSGRFLKYQTIAKSDFQPMVAGKRNTSDANPRLQIRQSPTTDDSDSASGMTRQFCQKFVDFGWEDTSTGILGDGD